jgi:hypothetical protein
MKRYRNRKAPAKCHNITVKPNAITPASTPLLEAPALSSYGFGRPGDPPLQGDDYSLGYYPDGFPKLPPCLDRRRTKHHPMLYPGKPFSGGEAKHDLAPVKAGEEIIDWSDDWKVPPEGFRR